jgi:hypothetical protein
MLVVFFFQQDGHITFNHPSKYIGYVPSFASGFKKMFHIKLDKGFIELDKKETFLQFIDACRDLRFWTYDVAYHIFSMYSYFRGL